MNLSAQLAAIEPKAQTERNTESVERSLPDNEIQAEIKRVCFDGMHYDNIFSAVGKLVSGGISHANLIANCNFFEQYVSPASETLKRKSISEIISDHEKNYPDQVGTRPAKNLPADCFNDEVYSNLPHQLREILEHIPDARKKDVALMGMITALSAAASRYRFQHGANGDVKEYSPHLHALVIGAAGSGKGNTRHGVALVEGITQEAIGKRKMALLQYKQVRGEYERERKQLEKNNQATGELMEPDKPKKYAFFISASDTTQAALVEALYENPIGCFAYDSELDTLTQGNQRKDFGGYSDIIRKVFHHEPLSRQRKTEGESYIVYQPRLAIILSGTHDQLRKLIQSEYNGLFSRMWYYVIPPTFQEYQPSRQQVDVVGNMCRELQGYIAERADLWSDELIFLTFTDQQENELTDHLRDKKAIEDKYGGDTGASWLRMAIIVKRIAVTLAFFQGATGEVPANCWRVAIGLLSAIKTHNIAALDIVRQNQGKCEISKEQYMTLKGSGMSDESIAELLGINRKTIQRRKKEWDGTK